MENEMIREAIEEAVTENIPAAQTIAQEAIPVAQEIVKDTVPTLEQTITAAPAPAAKHSFGKTLGCLAVLGAIIAFKPIKNRVNAKKEAKRQEEERKIQAMVDARVNELLNSRFGVPTNPANTAAENPEAKEQITDSNEGTNKDE